MAKHVIFLGAGASYTSGYPLAADLRKLFSSAHTFGDYLREKIGQIDKPSTNSLAKWFSDLSRAIELFREGGFGTVDEFSFLTGKQFPQEVHELKQLVGIILALHNPEKSYKLPSGQETNGFESSDYYPLIQRLFGGSDKVRDDIAILSYNYDPYFEFLLNRAYRTNPSPTMCFPWELLNDKDEFVTQDKFAGLEGLASGIFIFSPQAELCMNSAKQFGNAHKEKLQKQRKSHSLDFRCTNS